MNADGKKRPRICVQGLVQLSACICGSILIRRFSAVDDDYAVLVVVVVIVAAAAVPDAGKTAAEAQAREENEHDQVNESHCSPLPSLLSSSDSDRQDTHDIAGDTRG